MEDVLMNDKMKEDISIISKTFYSKIEKSYFCLNCKSNYKEYEILSTSNEN